MKKKSQNLDKFTLLFWVSVIGLFLVIRHILLTFAPEAVVSGYLFMFVLGFCVSLAINRSFHVSLLIGMLIVYGRMIYRYSAPKEAIQNYTSAPSTILFVIGLVSTVIAAYLLIPYSESPAIRYSIFFLLAYLLCSVGEWVIHKYVMHCYTHWTRLQDSEFPNPITRILQHACALHKDHHVSVNTDMTLTHIGDESALLFNWETLLMSAALELLPLMLVTWLLRLRIPIKIQVSTIACLMVLFGIVWNGTHPQMHRVQGQVDMPLTQGPPIWRTMSYPDLVGKNHEVHHMIKGVEKGNFNVVFLGADELLMSNNMNA